MKNIDWNQLDIEHGKAPTILYKYRDGGQFTEQLMRGIAYFSKAEQLNDPFEYRILREPVKNLTEAVAVAIELQKLSAAHLKPETDEWQTWMNETIDFFNRERWCRGMTGIPHIFEPGGGVLCMCESPNDIRMWSHYADAHKGVCLGLSTEIIHTKSRIAKVQYRSEMPKIPTAVLFTTPVGGIAPFIFKAESWSYEQEWRTFYAAGPLEFPVKLIASVIFGARIEAKTEDRLLSIIRLYQHRVDLFKAVLSKSRYAIDLEPMK